MVGWVVSTFHVRVTYQDPSLFLGMIACSLNQVWPDLHVWAFGWLNLKASLKLLDLHGATLIQNLLVKVRLSPAVGSCPVPCAPFSQVSRPMLLSDSMHLNQLMIGVGSPIWEVIQALLFCSEWCCADACSDAHMDFIGFLFLFCSLLSSMALESLIF